MVKLKRVYEYWCFESEKDKEDLKNHLGDKLFDDYMKIRNRIPKSQNDYKDFQKLKKLPIKDVQDFVDNFQSKSDKKKQDKKEGAEKLYEDSDWIVYRITTYPAAQYYGSGTKWCITGRYEGHEERGEEYFYDYIKKYSLDGGYYFYINKKNPTEKYCILQTKDKVVSSVWDAEDTNRGSSKVELGIDLPEVKEVGLLTYSVKGFLKALKDANIESVKKYIKDYNFSITDPVDDNGDSPLYYSLVKYQDHPTESRKNIIKFLLENGADANEWNSLAMFLDDPDMFSILLSYGADPNQQTFHNKPLLEATDSLDIINLLLKHGANPNEESGYGTLLTSAVSDQNLDKVKILLENGADPNKVIYTSPLHAAVSTGNNKIIKLLLDYGADVNIEDVDGKTPLFVQTLRNLESIRLLLENGADPNKKSGNFTPLRYAQLSRNHSLVDLLKKYGAKE